MATETKNSLAIILSRADYRENDSWLEVYSEEFGKLQLVARGAKKISSKLSGHLEPFNLVKLLIIKGRYRDYVGSALTTDSFLSIKSDLNKIFYAGAGLRLIKRLIKDGEADQQIFALLLNYLQLIDQSQTETMSQALGDLSQGYFTLRLLSYLGYQPELQHCLTCQQVVPANNNYFSLAAGGLICGTCQRAGSPESPGQLIKVSNNCIKLMRLFLTEDETILKNLKVTPSYSKELLSLANNFINFHF